MPTPNPWPASDEKSIREFFGPPGESQLVNAPVIGLGIKYLGSPVKTIRCHAKVSASLRRVLLEISNGPHADILAKYDGCFNLRPMRGGTSTSTHGWGIAIDFDAGRNGNRVHWPTQATMPIGVMEAFCTEGWLAAGSAWGRDAMHFQATR
jgi:hypothetical protein